MACCWLGALPLVACAQTPVRVLFVGNSFTHGQSAPVLTYNSASVIDENANLPATSPRYEGGGPSWGGVPGIFKKLCDQAGLNYEVHLEAISGQTLQFHYANALSVVNGSAWHKVVLQEYSTGPVRTVRGGNRSGFYAAATALEQAVHQVNAQAQVYLYETWARADLTYPAGSAYYGLPVDSMTADLHNGYYRQYATSGRVAAVAPAGDAWLRAIATGVATRNPYTPDATKLNLWGSDYYHASKWGSYLNALVLFYTLTSIDPRTLGSAEQAAAALGITPAAAVSLQQLAYQQVSSATLAARPPLAGPGKLTVYPNPAPGGAASISGAAPHAAVLVRDALGRVLQTTMATETGTAGLAGLPAGLYVVQAGASVAQLIVE